MRTKSIITALIIISLFSLSITATEKANFSGQWVMDKSKSEGIPPEMNQNMKVEQEGDDIRIETDLFQGDNVQSIPDHYVVDGKEVELPAIMNNGEKGITKRLAKWNEKENGFEVNDVSTFDLPSGKVIITTTRRWTITEDGKSLVIEIKRTAPNSGSASKRTFTKKQA